MKITVGSRVEPERVTGVLNLTPGVWRNAHNKDVIVFVGDRIYAPSKGCSCYTGIVAYENDKWMCLTNTNWETHEFYKVQEILTLTPTE